MTQTRTSSRAKVRTNAAKNLWTAPAKPLHYGREQFRFRVTRTARRLPTLNIDPWVESADWERANGSRTGELNFRQPLGAHAASMITYGDMVVCEWAQFGDGPWNRLWEMKIATPSHQILEGIIALSLSSVSDPASKSRVAWKFRTDHSHPNGWTADQITINVCRRFHIKIGQLPKGKYRITKYVPKSASPTDVITWAWGQERTHIGRRFDIDFSTGVLNVTELKEPRFLLIVGAAMLDATVSESLTNIASAVVATATRKAKGKKKATKLRVRVTDAGRIRRYGYIVKTLKAPAGISSVAELRNWARQQLAALFGRKKQITFTHPGIPLVDVGTALRVYLPEADVNQVVFVTDARHDLSAGAYEMEITVGFDDPFAAAVHQAQVQQKKDAAARARQRKTSAAKRAAPTPKKAASRSNKK